LKRILSYLLILLLFATRCLGTHNRAGYISYTWVAPSNPNSTSYTYNITVTTFTNLLPVYVGNGQYASPPDRCQLVVYFGDGDSATANRINGPLNDSICGPEATQGVVIVPNTTKMNVYTCQHTYSGPGQYWITMGDPNRNYFVNNIPNSGNTEFFIRSLLVIPNFGNGNNSSPILTQPPLQNGCLGECFYYNPTAYDPAGDSLSFALTPSLQNYGDTGRPVSGWTLPPTTGTISINPLTGLFEWCSPPSVPSNGLPPPILSEWNIGITVYKWAPGTGILLGEIELDMQINIYDCLNKPPRFLPLKDTCVVAGETLTFPVTAYDPELNDVSLSAVGGPLSVFVAKPAATFPSTPFVHDTAKSVFTWNTSCAQIQEQPYIVSFEAINDDISAIPPVPLANFATVLIRVIAPAPKKLLAKPSGSAINLTWSPDTCSNNLIVYAIYRIDSCSNWHPNYCQTGVPSYTGFTRIGTTTSSHFTDNNNGNGLVRGVNYSYLVVAEYSDGSQSYASVPVCTHLDRDVPIITNVDVISTDPALGKILIRWVKPLADSADFDSTHYSPPYQYVLLRDSGFNTPVTPIKTFSSPYFAVLALDTSYLDTLLNTSAHPYNYRIDFLASGGNIKVASTDNASSVYLSVNSAISGNILNLSWQAHVPWTNTNYVIYRQNQLISTEYDSIGRTSLQTYSDTGLVNKHTYCYLVKSIGLYSDTALPKPLINHSEIKCAAPEDRQAPCPPVLNGTGNCTRYSDSLIWTDPDNMHCHTNDVAEYKVYFTPVEGQPFTLIYDTKTKTWAPGNKVCQDTIYTLDSLLSIAGCFVVTALDSAGNESVFSNDLCIDNCPVYTLPNVFSPNGDGENDYFKPFPYKFVKDINLEVYDRWGLLVFKTNNPEINWDGINMYNKQPVTSGTYFYLCIVNEIHYEGIVPRPIRGFVQILQSKGDPQAH